MAITTAIQTRGQSVELIAELLSYGLTYRDLAFFNGYHNNETVRDYGAGRSIPPPSKLSRLELVRDLSRAVIAALGPHYALGHVPQYFCTKQKALGGVTPGYYIRHHGAARQFVLRTTPALFARESVLLASR